MNLSLKIEIYKEDDTFVALAPELNVSSFGESIEDAESAITEALEAFIDTCREMGTLDEVLSEAGFMQINGHWQKRNIVKAEDVMIAV